MTRRRPGRSRRWRGVRALAVLVLAACDTPEFVKPDPTPVSPDPPLAGSVSGFVRVDGRAAQGVRATLAPGDRSEWTDAGGRFAFTGLDAGQYTAAIAPPPLTRFDSVAKAAAVTRDAPHATLTFAGAWLPTASIRGVVVVEGEPANRTAVLSSDAIEARRESPGPEFVFDSLPAGRYFLTARPLTDEADLRFDTLELVLERGEAVVDTLNGAWLRTAAIRGSVLIDGLEDRTPGRLVVLSSQLLPGGRAAFRLPEGGAGFAFDSLRAGSYFLGARAVPDEEVAFDRSLVRVAPGDTLLHNAVGEWIRESAVAGLVTINGATVDPTPSRLVRLTATFLPVPIEFQSTSDPATGRAWFAREKLRSGRYGVTVVPSVGESGLVFDRVEFRAARHAVARVVVNGQWKGGLARVNTTAYVVQSVQRRDGTVDLVLGKRSMLRAFVTSTLPRPWPDSVTADVVAEAPGGAVRKRFRLERGRPRNDTGLPETVQEWDLSSSYNVLFPDGVVVPGNGLHITTQAHFSPAARLSLSPESSYTHFQRLAVHHPAKEFRLVVIPFHTGDETANGRLDARVGQLDRADPFFTLALESLPLGHFTLEVREPMRIDPAVHGSICTWLDLLDAQRSGDQNSFYYGVFNYWASDTGGPYAGCAYLSHPTAVGFIGIDRPGRAAGTFAHEIGHNLSLRHAPCGGPANVDPDFPYSGGTIGVWGYRPSTGEVVANEVPDLMSYCGTGSEWISDYHFEKALAFVNSGWSLRRGPKIAIPGLAPDASRRDIPGHEPPASPTDRSNVGRPPGGMGRPRRRSRVSRLSGVGVERVADSIQLCTSPRMFVRESGGARPGRRLCLADHRSRICARSNQSGSAGAATNTQRLRRCSRLYERRVSRPVLGCGDQGAESIRSSLPAGRRTGVRKRELAPRHQLRAGRLR